MGERSLCSRASDSIAERQSISRGERRRSRAAIEAPTPVAPPPKPLRAPREPAELLWERSLPHCSAQNWAPWSKTSLTRCLTSSPLAPPYARPMLNVDIADTKKGVCRRHRSGSHPKHPPRPHRRIHLVEAVKNHEHVNLDGCTTRVAPVDGLHRKGLQRTVQSVPLFRVRLATGDRKPWIKK